MAFKRWRRFTVCSPDLTAEGEVVADKDAAADSDRPRERACRGCCGALGPRCRVDPATPQEWERRHLPILQHIEIDESRCGSIATTIFREVTNQSRVRSSPSAFWMKTTGWSAVKDAPSQPADMEPLAEGFTAVVAEEVAYTRRVLPLSLSTTIRVMEAEGKGASRNE